MQRPAKDSKSVAVKETQIPVLWIKYQLSTTHYPFVYIWSSDHHHMMIINTFIDAQKSLLRERYLIWIMLFTSFLILIYLPCAIKILEKNNERYSLLVTG